MKRRMFVVLAAVGLLAGLSVSSVAAATGGPDRYQSTTTSYHLAIGSGHDWTIVTNPCDGSLWATGGQVGGPTENITATLSTAGTMISFVSVYVGGWGGSPYSWWGSFPVGGGSFTATDSLGGIYPNILVTVPSTSTTSYLNHGDYVSSVGGGAAAAHSCIGRPLQSQ